MSAVPDMVGLEQVGEGFYIRHMMTLDSAIDFACSGLAASTRARYAHMLYRFADDLPKHMDVAKVNEDHIVAFLRSRQGKITQSTLAWEYRVLYATFQKLVKGRKIKVNPVEFVPAPRRPDPDSADLVRVSTEEVGLMLAACETWSEKLCLNVLCYLGPRRHAASQIRLRDYWNGRLRFHEKGGKTIWKTVPAELAALIESAKQAGVYSSGSGVIPGNEAHKGAPDPDAYLIPPEGPLLKPDRDDRVIWRIVKRVADRAGVNAHTHSLRAAFAHFALDSGKDGKALQEMMGHKNPSTTERYTQRYDREKRMDTFADLSWASVGSGEDAARLAQSAASGERAEGSVPRSPATVGNARGRVAAPDNLPPDLLLAIRGAVQEEMRTR
jgi:integrase